MSAMMRRFAIALGFSVLVGAAFLPLGWTEWADEVRTRRTESRDGRPRREGSGGEAPDDVLSPLVRLVAPFVKMTVLMGVPAGLVVWIGFRRRRRGR